MLCGTNIKRTFSRGSGIYRRSNGLRMLLPGNGSIKPRCALVHPWTRIQKENKNEQGTKRSQNRGIGKKIGGRGKKVAIEEIVRHRLSKELENPHNGR